MVTTRIGLSNDGTVVTIAAGDLLEVALPDNPTTGYRWVLDPPPAGIRLVGDRMEHGNEAPVPGAGGTRVFAVLVERAGTLHAELRREWEAASVQTFTVHVEPGGADSRSGAQGPPGDALGGPAAGGAP